MTLEFVPQLISGSNFLKDTFLTERSFGLFRVKGVDVLQALGILHWMSLWYSNIKLFGKNLIGYLHGS